MFNPILMPLYKKVSQLNFKYSLKLSSGSDSEFIVYTICNDKELKEFQDDLQSEYSKIMSKREQRSIVLSEIREIYRQIKKGIENGSSVNFDKSVGGLVSFDEATDYFDIVSLKYNEQDYIEIVYDFLDRLISNLETQQDTSFEVNNDGKLNWLGSTKQLLVLLEQLNKSGLVKLPGFDNSEEVNRTKTAKMIINIINFQNRNKQITVKAIANAYGSIPVNLNGFDTKKYLEPLFSK